MDINLDILRLMDRTFELKTYAFQFVPLAIIAFIIFITTVSFLIYLLLISQAKSNLERTTSRIQEDLILKDGKWDMSLYNADNNISDAHPLYIITSEGFIIERSRPVHGLLDLSRYTLISQYTSPTTVETVTGESWRALSTPILSGDQAMGIILVTTYAPDERNLAEVDQHLQEVIEKVKSNVAVEGDRIDVDRVDSRQLPYDVSFQVVNRFNKVLFQSNNINSITRMPTFIDRSYIDNQLKGDRYKTVTDNLTHTRYLTLTTPLLNEKKIVSGIIVTGIPLEDLYSIVKKFALWNIFITTGIITLFVPIGYLLLKRIQQSASERIKQKSLPKLITFMKKDCKLVIDNESIDIPYSSYQYYFCQALFQKPQKKWEADELLEILGEDFGPEKWRKIYDTMVALNRKTANMVDKLFIIRDKRYFVNTQLAAAVRSLP